MHFFALSEWRSCKVGEYWISERGINASLYCTRSYFIQKKPLPDWCEGVERGLITDVVTKDGQSKFFRVISSGRRSRNASDEKFILCDHIISSTEVVWDYFKRQSDRRTTFNGRALIGRIVRKVAHQPGTITESREQHNGTFIYTVEYPRGPMEHWCEEDVLKYLSAEIGN